MSLIVPRGCGTGLTALHIAARYPGCMVHGIDISPKMIAVARQDAEKQDVLAEYSHPLQPSLAFRAVTQSGH